MRPDACAARKPSKMPPWALWTPATSWSALSNCPWFMMSLLLSSQALRYLLPGTALRLDVARPLPDLRRIRLEALKEASNEATELDQGLIARIVVEKEIGIRSCDRHERHVRRGSPEGGTEVKHRSDGAGSRQVPKQGLGIEARRWIGDGGIVQARWEVGDERDCGIACAVEAPGAVRCDSVDQTVEDPLE